MESDDVGRTADEAAIRALLDRLISRWDAGDAIGYASAYTGGGDCVSFLGEHHRGLSLIHIFGAPGRPVAVLDSAETIGSVGERCSRPW